MMLVPPDGRGCVNMPVVELNKLGRGQAEIQACSDSESERAPALLCRHTSLNGEAQLDFRMLR